MSATEYLIDASTRHQIMLQRLSGGAFNKLKPILEQLQLMTGLMGLATASAAFSRFALH